MKELYDKYLTSHFQKANPATAKAFETTARAYEAWYEKFLPSDKDAKILDVGCGMGHFLYFLKREGYTNFFGIDISAQQVNYVKENITDKVAIADVFSFLKEDSYDAIIVNDVVEHMPKERLLEFLHLCFKSLRVGGVIFVKTGNMANPFGLRLRYVDITHYLGFTEHSLSQVLNVTGFQDIQIIGTSYIWLSVASVIPIAARAITHGFLKLMFFIQGYPVPKILEVCIIGIGTKK